jgi:hypothetical protein
MRTKVHTTGDPIGPSGYRFLIQLRHSPSVEDAKKEIMRIFGPEKESRCVYRPGIEVPSSPGWKKVHEGYTVFVKETYAASA